MGLTYVTTSIQGFGEDSTPYETEFLVDTGAVDCMVPASKLKEAGIEPKGTRAYELANGTLVEYPFGFASVKFMGDEAVTQVIFGPEDAEPILGVVALEMTGIFVDPRTNSLKRMPAIPFK